MDNRRQEEISRRTRTLVLTREAIVATMDFADYVTAVERSFRLYASGSVAVPEVVHIPVDHGAFHVKSAGLTDEPRYIAVKVNGNFPDNRERTGLPTIQGAITLCNGSNGYPLAILDSMEVTAQRTAASTAVAAKHLANQDSRVATIIGCGVQGQMQLAALLHILPLEQVYTFDINTERCSQFAEEMTDRWGVPVTPVGNFAEGTRASQAIVTCTSSRTMFLERRHIRPGAFIAAVGADNDDKQELDPALLEISKVVADVLEQCARIGELHHALEAGTMTRSSVRAELGDVVLGAKVGRASPEEILIFDSTGSAFQDVAAAAVIYEKALEQGLGLPVELA